MSTSVILIVDATNLLPFLLKESLNELEDHDLDALVADLGTRASSQESSSSEEIGLLTDDQRATSTMTQQPERAAPPPTPAAPKVTKTVRLQMLTLITLLKV